jgi:hypothetical protein
MSLKDESMKQPAARLAGRAKSSATQPTSGLSSLKQYRMPERGARIARREERVYWA